MSDKQLVEQIKLKQADLLSDLAAQGWQPSDDEDEALFALGLLNEHSSEISAFVKAAAHTQSEQSQNWARQVEDWEKVYSADSVGRMRSELLASALKKQVTSSFLEDMKRRWEKQLFSSVSEEWVVIGDVYTHNLVHIPIRKEVDVSNSVTHFGRESLTYSTWEKLSGEWSTLSVRPKINGERMVAQPAHEYNGHVVVNVKGFQNFSVAKAFYPQLMEYYAGSYYVLYPLITKPLTYVVHEMGVDVEREFLPHPFMSVGDFISRQREFRSHKYDGFMLYSGQTEYRVKWNPTVDVMVKGHVWEVSLSGHKEELYLERPRYGKDASSEMTAKARIRAQIRGRHVLDRLPVMVPPEATTMVGDDPVQKESMRMRSGAKIMFFTMKGEVLLIRDEGKPLDLIGGQIDFAETPMQCAVREVREETKLVIDPSILIKVGTSQTAMNHELWVSHLFMAIAPVEMLQVKGIELYKLEEIANSQCSVVEAVLKAPVQPWLRRHFDLAYLFSGSMSNMFAALLVANGESPVGKYDLTQAVWAEIGTRYARFLMAKRKEFASMMEFMDYLKKMNLPMSDVMLQTLQMAGEAQDLPKTLEGRKVLVREVFNGDREMSRKDFYSKVRLRHYKINGKQVKHLIDVLRAEELIRITENVLILQEEKKGEEKLVLFVPTFTSQLLSLQRVIRANFKGSQARRLTSSRGIGNFELIFSQQHDHNNRCGCSVVLRGLNAPVRSLELKGSGGTLFAQYKEFAVELNKLQL